MSFVFCLLSHVLCLMPASMVTSHFLLILYNYSVSASFVITAPYIHMHIIYTHRRGWRVSLDDNYVYLPTELTD